jgi:hypothetical protein
MLKQECIHYICEYHKKLTAQNVVAQQALETARFKKNVHTGL